jgi:ribose 5-phosphate isomerase RpiB
MVAILNICLDGARLARQHNGANVVAMGPRLIALDCAAEIACTFLLTEVRPTGTPAESKRYTVSNGTRETTGAAWHSLC